MNEKIVCFYGIGRKRLGEMTKDNGNLREDRVIPLDMRVSIYKTGLI